jgi:DNA-directed RNA polymerase subunit RPC12/RpoP
MAISKTKMQMVIDNYFKDECDVNTSIRQAFEKGFRIGVKKGTSTDKPQGEWIEDYNGNGWNDYWDYTCSNCGKRYERADAVLCKANFCPNCGAKMKGADDEHDK